MGSVRRHFDIGTERGERWLREVGKEFKQARLRLGLSQQAVADAARIDRADYSRIERAKLPSLTVMSACRIGSILGLDVSMKAFPGGQPIRDAGQARRLKRLVEHVGRPLSYRTDVGLPHDQDGRPDQRAWDTVIFGHGERTTVELEACITDVQDMTRRHNLKRRDDPAEHFLLVVADTRHNRQVLLEYAELFADLPRLRTVNVLKALRNGQHPPTGVILL
jgi:transcriptional regulator with XRE-family HTH domain